MEVQNHYPVEHQDKLQPVFSDESYKHLCTFPQGHFANVTYSEIEASGPPSSPLGFPAPHVIPSKVVLALCLDNDGTNIWTEGKVLLHRDRDQKEPEPSNIGYMFNPVVLRQTLCGELITGTIVRKINAVNALEQSNGHLKSSIAKYSNSIWIKTDKLVAIKVVRRKAVQHSHSRICAQSNPENPWKEIAAMQLLGNSHPNVIHLLAALMDDECLYEVMKFCSGENLSSFMHSHPHGISEAQARSFFVQIMTGLFHLHQNGICHHDISTDNIMLDEDESRCVIIDFGMCLRVPYSYPDDPTGITDDVTDVSMGTIRRLIHSNGSCGKLRFVSPEIFQMKYEFDGLTSDIWAAGLILFVLLTGKYPYNRPDENKDSGYYDLIDKSYYWNRLEVDPSFSWGRKISNAVVDLLKAMLCPDPRRRATLGWILKHEWMH